VIPLLLARELPEAERLLREAGVETIEVKQTAPPRRKQPAGPLRVVRQRRLEQGVELVVAASMALRCENE
jgi:hypothetical protein